VSEDIERAYREYYPRLVRFISSLCDDVDLAQDIAQNAFLQAMRRIDSFQGKSSFQTWLFSIGKHELARYYRKNRNYTLAYSLENSQFDHQIDEYGLLSVETQAIGEIAAKEVSKALTVLGEPQSTIALLRLFDELSFKEIATRVQRSEVYCRVSYFRVMQTIRKEWQ